MDVAEFLHLTSNAIILAIFLIIYDLVMRTYFSNNILFQKNTTSGKIIHGCVFGLIGIIVMSMSLKLEMFQFDARFILIAISSLFFETATTLICLVIICLYRVYTGGSTGIILEMLAIGFGIIAIGRFWTPSYHRNSRIFFADLFFYGFITQGAYLFIIILFVPLPLLIHISLPLFTFYPLVTAFIAYLFNVKGQRPSKIIERIEDSFLFNLRFNSKLIGISISSPTKEMMKTNPRLCQLLGYTEQELRQISWLDYTHPDDREISVKLFNQLLSGEIEQYNLKKRLLTKDGEIVNIQLNVFGVHNEANQMEVLVTTYIELNDSMIEVDAISDESVRD